MPQGGHAELAIEVEDDKQQDAFRAWQERRKARRQLGSTMRRLDSSTSTRDPELGIEQEQSGQHSNANQPELEYRGNLAQTNESPSNTYQVQRAFLDKHLSRILSERTTRETIRLFAEPNSIVHV